jgi:hypothetical protein
MLVFKQVLPEKPAQQVRILRLYVYFAFARVSWTRWLLDHVPSVFNFGRFHCVALDADARLLFTRCAGTSSYFRVGIGQAAARRNVAQSLSTSLERRPTVGRCWTGPFAWKPGSGGARRPCVPWFHLPRGHWGPSPFLDWVAVHPLIMPFVIFELPFSCRSHVFDFSFGTKRRLSCYGEFDADYEVA